MSDLFKKLNTLVKAGINDFLGDDLRGSIRKALDPEKLGKNIDREIAALRQRINEAVEYEESLRARVQALQTEVARWDQQADEAVAAGNDSAARYAIEHMQRAEQRLNMAQSDLREHQLVTQELIQRVNTLEATVADARRSQAEPPPQTAERGLSDVLRDAREKIAQMGDLVTAKSQPEPVGEEPVDDEVVEDDLARRRERLSKPK